MHIKLRKPAWQLAAVLLALQLGGCAMLVRTPESAPVATGDSAEARWQQHYRQLAAISQFQLEARMAVKGVGWSGNLRWQQNGKQIKLVVTGPLGVGGLRATGTIDRAYVETGQEAFWTDDPEATFLARAGWQLPIRYLRYWALGMPAPSIAEQHTLDAQGRLVTLQQAGWEVRYASYQPQGQLALPSALVLTGVEAQIRVVIDRWQLGP